MRAGRLGRAKAFGFESPCSGDVGGLATDGSKPLVGLNRRRGKSYLAVKWVHNWGAVSDVPHSKQGGERWERKGGRCSDSRKSVVIGWSRRSPAVYSPKLEY